MQVENTEDLTGPSGSQRRVRIVKVCNPKSCMMMAVIHTLATLPCNFWHSPSQHCSSQSLDMLNLVVCTS